MIQLQQESWASYETFVRHQHYSRVTKVVGITTDDTIEALYEDGDYEDNLIALTAETNMCDAVITRDKDFKNFRVVLTPEEYLRYKNNVNE